MHRLKTTGGSSKNDVNSRNAGCGKDNSSNSNSSSNGVARTRVTGPAAVLAVSHSHNHNLNNPRFSKLRHPAATGVIAAAIAVRDVAAGAGTDKIIKGNILGLTKRLAPFTFKLLDG
jgi:hypothetical protein